MFSRADRNATKRNFRRAAQRPLVVLVAAQPSGIRVAKSGQIAEELPKISVLQIVVTTATPDIRGTVTLRVS